MSSNDPLGIAWPGPSMLSIISTDPSIVVIDSNGYHSPNSSRCINSSDIPFSDISISTVDQTVVKDCINRASSLWPRWIPGSENYEDLRSYAALSIAKHLLLLRKHGIKTMLFCTASPHHWDSSVLSIACQACGIKQIYLYPIVIDGYLLPVLQTEGITSRQPLSLPISLNTYHVKIHQFLENKLNGNPPASNTILTRKKKSYYNAFFALFAICLKLLLKHRSPFLYSFNPCSNLSRHSFWESLNVLNRQREFLMAYRSIQLNSTELDTLNCAEEPFLLLVANYQPEATTDPEGSFYSSHIDVVLSLRGLGYTRTLYYKEHPATKMYWDDVVGLTRVGLYRSSQYLSCLIELGCKFIPDDFKLSVFSGHHWYVPVTINGTIAIERSLMGLHTIYCGVVWFKGLPGTHCIGDISTLNAIPKHWTTPDPVLASNAKIFLESMLDLRTLHNPDGIGSNSSMRPTEHESSAFFSVYRSEVISLLNGIRRI